MCSCARAVVLAPVILLHCILATPVQSFGTEFNPQLYKQSMLALVECAQAIPMLKESPRVFFMDQNIKDMTSLEPFTHVYTFQIGMPEVILCAIIAVIEHCYHGTGLCCKEDNVIVNCAR